MDLMGLKFPLEGYGSELSTFLLAVVIFLIATLVRFMKLVGIGPKALFNFGNKEKDNPGRVIPYRIDGIPGKADSCIRHGEALVVITERLNAHILMDEKRTDDIVREMKDGFQRIYDKLDRKQDR